MKKRDINIVSFDNRLFYRRPMKLREGNVFTGVCQSICQSQSQSICGTRSFPGRWVCPGGGYVHLDGYVHGKGMSIGMGMSKGKYV